MNRSIRRFASALVATTALTIGIIASSASPASAIAAPFITTSLAISGPTALNIYTLTVSGHHEMTRLDAEIACADPGNPVKVELYGKDTGPLSRDDLLITEAEWDARVMNCTFGNTGMDYSVSIPVNGNVLDEDRPGNDELYASIRFFDFHFQQTILNDSNVLVGSF